MKLTEKTPEGSKVKKKYDKPQSPYQRLLLCSKTNENQKEKLRKTHTDLDPIELAKEIEKKLAVIFEKVDWLEKEREELRCWAEENEEDRANGVAADLRGAEPPVAIASSGTAPLKSNQSLAKSEAKGENTRKHRVS